MNVYLFVKWLYIVFSVLFVGIGFGLVFYFFFVNCSVSFEVCVVVVCFVVCVDLWFMMLVVIVQLFSGIWLVYVVGWLLVMLWLVMFIVLYLLVGVCWLLVLWLQLKMVCEVEVVLIEYCLLYLWYQQWQVVWEGLGYFVFVVMLVVFFLMVNKLVFWG